MFVRMYSSSELTTEVLGPRKGICEIMISCPALAIDIAINQNRIRVSLDIVEDVLEIWECWYVGISVPCLEWARKQRNYMHSVRGYYTIIESLAKISNIRSCGILWILWGTRTCLVLRHFALYCEILGFEGGGAVWVEYIIMENTFG